VIELWSLVQPLPVTSVARVSQRLEAGGWDGVLFPDSQNVTADCVAAMTVAALSTATLRVGTGVTNPVTRHPASMASALATVSSLSGGRAMLGIGRGDSALAHLGQAPARSGDLEDYVRLLRRYLRKETIPFGEIARYVHGGARALDALGLAGAPDGSQLRWLPSDLAVPHVEVAASGPRTIRFGASEADGVMLAVGADEERLDWATQLARQSGAKQVTAFVNVVAHPDADQARAMGRAMVAAFARFSVMEGRAKSPMDLASARELSALRDSYDMRQHGAGGGSSPRHATVLSDGFIDRFGIVGDPAHCLARLRAVIGLGVDRLVIVGPTSQGSREAVAVSRNAFAEEVLPSLR
jgi:5,10-methylenetetrahydromethanopterin reductase